MPKVLEPLFIKVYRINGVWDIYFCLKLSCTLHQSQTEEEEGPINSRNTNYEVVVHCNCNVSMLHLMNVLLKSSELIKAKDTKYISSPHSGAIWAIKHFMLLSLTSLHLSLSTGRQRYLQQRINRFSGFSVSVWRRNTSTWRKIFQLLLSYVLHTDDVADTSLAFPTMLFFSVKSSLIYYSHDVVLKKSLQCNKLHKVKLSIIIQL